MQTLTAFITDYFSQKGVEYKDAGDQFVLKNCPACKDDKFHHFYMNKATGLWDCKKCFSKGHFNQFRSYFGDTDLNFAEFDIKIPEIQEKQYRSLDNKMALNFATRLWSSQEDVQKYLEEERGLTKETLEHFKIGVSDDGKIAIPIYEDGLLINLRYRKNPSDTSEGPKYNTEKNCRSALFNVDVLKNGKHKSCFLTEGEFDAMKLIQEGFTNTVSVTLGAGSFPDEWKEDFKNMGMIYIVFDQDEAGRKGAAKVADILGPYRCKIINLPCPETQSKTDVTDYFMRDSGTKVSFISLIEKAKYASGVDEDAVKHISEFNEELRERLLSKEYFGEKTGFEAFDDIMGGLRKGRLVIVSGLTNCGKTSWSLNVALSLSDRKIPTYFFSLEMPPLDIAKKTLMLKAQLTNNDLKDIEDPSAVLNSVDSTLATFTLGDLPVYLFNGSGEAKIETLVQTARMAVEKHGVKCIFVDHLHYFVQNYGNLTGETSKLVRQMKQLAKTLDIPIVLLCHLNRGGRQQKRKGLYVPSLSDLRDSGAIEQDADQVIFVCRDSESEDAEEREKTVIKLAKNRDGSAGRGISMKFIEHYGAFIELVGGTDYEQEAKDVASEKVAEVSMPDASIEDISYGEMPF